MAPPDPRSQNPTTPQQMIKVLIWLRCDLTKIEIKVDISYFFTSISYLFDNCEKLNFLKNKNLKKNQKMRKIAAFSRYKFASITHFPYSIFTKSNRWLLGDQ